MAELLVYNKIQWFNVLTKEEQEKHTERNKLRAQGWYELGDVVDVKPDGHYCFEGKIRNCDLECFCIVKVLGKVQDYIYLLQNEIMQIDNKLYERKRIKNINNSQLISDINEVELLSVEDKEEWQLLTHM